MKNTSNARLRKRSITRKAIFTIGLLSIFCSFALGIQTAGDVDTVSRSAAVSVGLMGDLNRDEQLDIQDVVIVLEVLDGSRTPNTEELMADPDQSGTLTLKDALLLLRSISPASSH